MSRKFNLLIVFFALLVLLGMTGSALAQSATRVYWTEWFSYNEEMSRIARANVDGSGIETVIDGFVDPVGCKDLAIDSEAGKLYFGNRSAGLLERSNLDGSGRETLVEGINPIGLALDVADGKIYWSDYTYSDPTIRRANIDGSDMEILGEANAGCSLEGIALDLTGRYVYFAERMTQHIKRVSMEGGYVALILACWEGVGHPRGLAVANNRIYWSSDVNIYSATLLGDDVQPVIEELAGKPYALEYDADAGKLYWVTGSAYGNSMVQRCNLNGTGLETLVEGFYNGYGIALEMGGTTPAPDGVPQIVQLGNHPNPFNPRTELAYSLPAETRVRLEVFDSQGRRVRTLVDGVQAAGPQAVVWNGLDDRGRNQASGVYFARLVAGELMTRHKMVLMK